MYPMRYVEFGRTSCCWFETWKYAERYVEAPLGSEEPKVLFMTRSTPVTITSVFLPC